MIFSRLSRIAAIATAVAAVVAIICGAAVIAGCSVKYSLSGASIPPEAKTVSIAYFPNNAMLVNPNLSAVFTDKLRDRFNRQTKLQAVDENGDFAFEGEIVNYATSPASISANDQAARNRLTITVRVNFTNVIEPQNSFQSRTFSQFEEYDSQTQMLSDVEDQLIESITDALVEDIFNAAASNW